MPVTRPKGSPKTPGSGRQKGTPNKATKELREMILQALDESGGVEYLVRLANDNPASFATLLGKVLPMTVSAEVKGKLELITRRIVDRAGN